MKQEERYYAYYAKLMKMSLEKRIVEVPEFRLFAERYPHLAESIRLRREIRRLREGRRSQKEKSTLLRIDRDIHRIETKLKQENVRKLLHGESRKEAIFNVRLGIATSTKRAHNILRMIYADARSVGRDLRRLIRKKLPPTIIDLKSLDTAEKGLSVREWIQKRNRSVNE